jgi:hypothetical protein
MDNNKVNIIDLDDERKNTEEAIHESNPQAKITAKDLDVLIGYVSQGMSLKEIHEKLDKKFAIKKRTKKTKTQEKQIDEETQEQVIRLLQPVIHPPYTVSVGVRYAIDLKRVLEISTTEPLGDRDIISAQEEIYVKLLESLRNLIEKS